MTRTRLGRARGFTLVEVLVALVVLAIGAAGIIQLMGQSQQQNARRRISDAARRIADSEVEAARVAGLSAVPSAAFPTRLADDGTPDVAGSFRVTVTRQVICDPESAHPADDGTLPPGCAGALARVTVLVEHLDDGTWTLRTQRTIVAEGDGPATGHWNLAGAP